ncbi:unnamed protein product [Cylindrotheca closterium]|uniref:Sulfate transporter n=1 Tax=Cylindrotheca closterium TaxID=2856 RepID=A0AAD2FTH6_9STRA|nr:unnamed protein product [Cylindrotheca closterium]
MGRSYYYNFIILCVLFVAQKEAAHAASTITSAVPSIIPNPFAKKKVSKFAQLQSFVLGRNGKKKNGNGGSSNNNNNNNNQKNNNNNNNNNQKNNNNNNNAEIVRIQAQNVLAGLASAIALIPEASTFAMTAGLSPLVGLGSTIIMATFSGTLGGRPGLVSGASATVSMILKPLCQQEGPLMVGLAVILAGLMQICLGLTRCGKYIRVVPRPVMLGFVNGLAIKVVQAQIPHFQHPHGVWLRGTALKWHSILVVASALIIEYFPKIAKGSIIPSPLIALGFASILVEKMELPVPKLVDIVGPEAFQGGIGTLVQALFPFAGSADESSVGIQKWLPPYGSILTLEHLRKVFPTALEVAVVGLLQSLLALQIVDERTNTKGKNTKESIAQGLGNLVSGSMGGMGGSALLGQSLVNVQAGGTGRLSSIAVAIFVLAGVTFFAPILERIPVAALVGLMLTVAQHTFSWGLLDSMVKGQVPWADIILTVSVTLTTTFVNMAAAVGLGVLASALRFAWQASCNISARSTGKGTSLQNRYINVQGPLFFGSALTFQKLCQPSEQDREIATKLENRFLLKAKSKANEGTSEETPSHPPKFMTGRETVIDFLNSQVWDHAAIMAIESVCKRYHDLGVKLHLRHVSPDCREKILECSDVGEWSTEFDVDASSDPTYLVGVDPINKSQRLKK